MFQVGPALPAPLAMLYGGLIRTRNWYFDHVSSAVRHATVPVISVGNITVGGTGKTPLVIEIVRRLVQSGRRPAILTRGYKAAAGGPADEVLEFSAALPDVPVVVNANRVAGAVTAVQKHRANCVVLDDGFQHRRLHRDLDIVLIDALNPWGGGRLLPAGRLREPRTSLRRADVFVITRVNQAEHGAVAAIAGVLRHYAGDRPLVLAALEAESLTFPNAEIRPAAEIAGRPVLAVSGLGNPHTFEKLVESLAGQPVAHLRYADHHRYDPNDVTRIVAAAGDGWVVTTRKDWVKLHPLWPDRGPPLVRLDMKLTLTAGAPEFESRLRAVAPASGR
jgi:tetraacyldisaccharide 4'-kinase